MVCHLHNPRKLMLQKTGGEVIVELQMIEVLVGASLVENSRT